MSRSVLCAIGGISERELSVWEHEDLVAPVRVERVRGQIEALYDREALRRVRVIRTLSDELEVNIPGIGVILHLLDQMSR
jgi:DNA-binding transcriptional MerR regulator